MAQIERFQDCSGKSPFYAYDDRSHLIAVTDGLNQTTRRERKPDGEVVQIDHSDGTAEPFTYNRLWPGADAHRWQGSDRAAAAYGARFAKKRVSRFLK